MSPAIFSFSNHCNAEAKRSNDSRTITNFGKRMCSKGQVFPKCILSKNVTLVIRPTGGFQIALPSKQCCAAPDSTLSSIQKPKCSSAATGRYPPGRARSMHLFGGTIMIEAVMIWNEPNNKSHWDFEIDPEWRMFSKMAIAAADAVAEANPHLPRVLGGI